MKKLIIALILSICMTACTPPDVPGGLLLPEPDSLKEFPLAASSGRKVELRLAVDMEPVLPPAGDQGKQGSCVSWALGYNLFSYYERAHAGLQDYGISQGIPDPRKVYSPAFIYNYLKQQVIPTDCQRGILFKDAFHIIMNKGNCQWADFPYHSVQDGCKGGVTTASIDGASKHKGYRFQRITKSEYDFKVQVQSGYPVIIGVYTSESLYDDGKNADTTRKFIWNPAQRDKWEYHAMLVVGYDQQYFKLMNSWGADWGNKGFVWIPYKKLLDRTVEAYTAEKLVPDRGIAAIPFAMDSTIKHRKHMSLKLPDNSFIAFDNFSMNLNRMNASVSFSIFDSTSNHPYKGYLQEGEQKQFYISDSLVTIYSDFTNNKVRPVHMNMKIDSGVVDENIKGIDSMLRENYSYLKSKKNLTEGDKRMLKEFVNWEGKYQMVSNTNDNNDSVNWKLLTVLLSLIPLGVWAFRQWRKTRS
ncbi:C1 family peptidase [Chitinophaga sp. LS1]|uniref:C1 family peptidase n=1 Tax=Chitinophaga sp. LS1 TaxID=3051176 RepID=UPI002AAAAD35|nr:C1 family peptidase [Chitinophaga sp. LS1]WPV65281.1 C1 family peptidase [Chitinophaga sp. LS1]